MKMHLIDISRPQGVLWEEGTLSRSLTCGSTTRYYLATPDGVCSSSIDCEEATLTCPIVSNVGTSLRDVIDCEYTTLTCQRHVPTYPDFVTHIIDHIKTGQRRCRYMTSPSFTSFSELAGERGHEHHNYMSPGGTMSSRTRGIAGRQRQSRTEPHGGSLIDSPTLTRQRLCGESGKTLIYNAVGVAFTHEATKQHLRRCYAPSSHLPHIVATLQCGAIYKATAKRLALNHENSLFY